MSALPQLPPQTMWSLLDQLRDEDDAALARLCLMEISAEENMEWHEALHELAVRIAKMGPADALALAIVYDRLGHLPPPDGSYLADHVRTDMNRLLGQVSSWAVVVKARRYHARLKNWAEAKPKAPRSLRPRRRKVGAT